MQPTFVLSVEMEELFIQAGLQDRVIQTYEGCMYMDFAQELIESRSYSDYQRLPAKNLPPLWLAYLPDPSNSGKIHSDVKVRWKQAEGVPAKFPGSGGAVIGMCTEEEQLERLKGLYE